jgi:hypothetical protein
MYNATSKLPFLLCKLEILTWPCFAKASQGEAGSAIVIPGRLCFAEASRRHSSGPIFQGSKSFVERYT